MSDRTDIDDLLEKVDDPEVREAIITLLHSNNISERMKLAMLVITRGYLDVYKQADDRLHPPRPPQPLGNIDEIMNGVSGTMAREAFVEALSTEDLSAIEQPLRLAFGILGSHVDVAFRLAERLSLDGDEERALRFKESASQYDWELKECEYAARMDDLKYYEEEYRIQEEAERHYDHCDDYY